jgi:hypothetical protein
LYVAVVISGFLEFLKQHLLTCPIKQHLGIDCPGCGFQRSVLSFFQGDLIGSFKLYPATMPLMALLLFTLIHLRFDLKHGAFIIKIFYVSVTLIIIINYIYPSIKLTYV